MYARFPKTNKLFFALLCASVPLTASADISFTEIMYDAPNADTGHEWLEFQNTGKESVSTAGWKFFEGGVNHKLAAQRSPIIDAGAYAIIANDAKQFSADNPSYAGALFQSSFSLNNTGETIALKNASSTELASATYASSAGASGNGNTLNLVGETWEARKPSPGASASSAAIAPPAAASVKSSSPKSTSKGNPATTSSVSTGSLSAQADAATGTTSFGILPWIFGLLAVILAGAGAVFMMPAKKPHDEYTIIEDES